MKTRFVLIETSHAGNVGAAARAMKTMGFDDLVLVRPRWPNVLRISHLCATAMTPRDFGPPTRTPRQHFELLLSGALDVLAVPDEAAPPTDEPAPAPRCNQSGVAFLFGCERFGMSNDDVYRSDVALSIPSNPQFGSCRASTSFSTARN
jgi:tRNA/rRNA methyltransferase